MPRDIKKTGIIQFLALCGLLFTLMVKYVHFETRNCARNGAPSRLRHSRSKRLPIKAVDTALRFCQFKSDYKT